MTSRKQVTFLQSQKWKSWRWRIGSCQCNLLPKCQKPFQRQDYQQNQGYRGPSSASSSSSTKMSCSYCKIPGHVQKDCRKRKAAKAPCVDENGKLYAKQINAVDGAQPEQNSSTSGQYAQAQTTSSLGMASLNWSKALRIILSKSMKLTISFSSILKKFKICFIIWRNIQHK